MSGVDIVKQEDTQTPKKDNQETCFQNPQKLQLQSLDEKDLFERLMLVKSRIYNEARETPEYRQELELVEKNLTQSLIIYIVEKRPVNLNQVYEQYEQETGDEDTFMKFMAKYGKYLVEEVAHYNKMKELLYSLLETRHSDEDEQQYQDDDSKDVMDAVKELEEEKQDSDFEIGEEELAQLISENEEENGMEND